MNISVPERWDSSPVEHRRKIAGGVNQAGMMLDEQSETLADHESRITTLEGLPTGIQGTYDHLVDNVLLGNGAGAVLPTADNFTPGEYYEIDAPAGLFVTPIPELNGRTGARGDRIIATDSGWIHITGTGAYLSSELDDEADGVITFNKPAKGFQPALDPEDYERRQESEEGDAATLATAQMYADTGDAVVQGNLDTHVGQIVGPATNPHGVKEYSDGGDMAVAEWTASNFVYAAYGGMDISAAESVPDIGAGWQPFDFYDQFNVPPRSVNLSLNGEFSFEHEGVYAVALTGTVSHDSSNQGRSFQVRLWDVTTGAQIGTPALIGTGRNAEATTIPLTRLFNITEAQENDVLRLEYGNGDTYTGVEWVTLSFSTWKVSEWKGPTLPSIGGAFSSGFSGGFA